jgi:hypothetical protein
MTTTSTFECFELTRESGCYESAANRTGKFCPCLDLASIKCPATEQTQVAPSLTEKGRVWYSLEHGKAKYGVWCGRGRRSNQKPEKLSWPAKSLPCSTSS